jgi:hypothetical protein
MPHVGVGQRRPEQPAAVADPVVGEHAVDGDAMQGEPVVGAAPEAGAALGALVTQDLHIGQPRVVIDRGMQVVIAATRPVGAAVDRPGSPTLHSVAAPVGDAA